MSEEDRRHWDDRYSAMEWSPVTGIGPPLVFAGFEHLFPREGRALDVACGRGRDSVWLAMRDMEVLGIDVSPVAIDQARMLAAANGVSDRCRFMVHDLGRGLPPGPPVNLVLCHRFRDPALDAAIVTRLAPEGLLAIATLSEVDAGPGRFRSRSGELRDAFSTLEPLAGGEGQGIAWLIGRKPAD